MNPKRKNREAIDGANIMPWLKLSLIEGKTVHCGRNVQLVRFIKYPSFEDNFCLVRLNDSEVIVDAILTEDCIEELLCSAPGSYLNSFQGSIFSCKEYTFVASPKFTQAFIIIHCFEFLHKYHQIVGTPLECSQIPLVQNFIADLKIPYVYPFSLEYSGDFFLEMMSLVRKADEYLHKTKSSQCSEIPWMCLRIPAADDLVVPEECLSKIESITSKMI